MKKIIGIGIILIILLSLSGCTRINENIGDVIDPPNVYVTSKSTRTGYEGLDYVVYVDVTVHNRGGDGKATVWTSLTQDGNQWSKRQTIYLNGDETRSLIFTYKEISFWGSGGSYRAWIE